MSFEKGKAVSAKLLQQAFGVGAKAIPIVGQANMGKQIIGSISKTALGYDFFGLITKLGFFYVFAGGIIGYFNAVLFGSGFVKAIADIAHINLSPALPAQVITFFQKGILVKKADAVRGTPDIYLSPWDVMNLLLFTLVCAEAISYFEDNKKANNKLSYITIGIWAILIGGMALLIVLPIMKKLAGQKLTAQDIANKYGQPLTTNYSVTVLYSKTNQSQSFVMTPQQIASLPQDGSVYVTAGPVVSSLASNLSDTMFKQLFGVSVN